MLLVVVDQPRIRRRRDDSVEDAAEFDLARVTVDGMRVTMLCAHLRERLDPRQRVERVAPQEGLRLLDWTAFALVLVAPVRLDLRHARHIQIEVRRPSRRARGTSQDHVQHVAMLVLGGELAERQQLPRGPRREPLAQVAGRLCVRTRFIESRHDLA